MIYSEEHILVDAINAPVQYGKKGDCCPGPFTEFRRKFIMLL